MKEIWKDIDGFYGFYQVSNFGRVKSLKRQAKNNPDGSRPVKERILLLAENKRGYVTGHLSMNGKLKDFRAHRLVAIAFIPNPKNKREVNHKNGIKSDNRVENLEWNSATENMNHSTHHGLKKLIANEKLLSQC